MQGRAVLPRLKAAASPLREHSHLPQRKLQAALEVIVDQSPSQAPVPSGVHFAGYHWQGRSRVTACSDRHAVSPLPKVQPTLWTLSCGSTPNARGSAQTTPIIDACRLLISLGKNRTWIDCCESESFSIFDRNLDSENSIPSRSRGSEGETTA